MNKFVLFLLAVISWGFHAQAKELLDIKGDYLLYSFDFNYVYGQGNVQIKAKDFTIQAASVEIDMANRVARVSRNCQVQAGKENYAADILEIDLENLNLKFTTYKDSILSWTLPTQKKTAEVKDAVAKQMVFRDYETLKKSLVYFLSSRIVITGSYRLYGYQSTVFVEGIQSLAFKKFKLDKGIKEQGDQGFGIDRIWYYPSQGVVVNSHLLVEKAVKNGFLKSSSGLDLKYDAFGKDVVGARGKINFNSLNSLAVSKKSGLNLNINYLTDNMFNAAMDFKTQWTPQFSSDWIAEYSRTAAKREELWLRLRSGLNGKVLGNVSLNLAYEKEKQYLLEISLQNQAIKNFVISARHSRSRLLYNQDQYNSLSNSNFSLSYSNRLFNLAADYSFHKDLLLNQTQASPQFRLNVSPFRLYNGLLQVNFTSSFIINQLNNRGVRDDFSKANMGLALQSEKIQLGGGPEMSFSLAAEQLLDQDPANNFTSLGYIFKCSQSLADFADFNFLFNYQTRRKTEKWFIQGTTSQDWSAVLKLKEKENRVQGWVSLTYDTKTGHFTSGLLDCSVAIIKNWHLQSQMNYDFIFKNFSYDLYLIRRAGRIMIRGSYRSLSKQFLLEVLPN
jgi:lipopolysaccharide export system protein LptA